MGIEFILLAFALICVGLTGGSYKKLFATKFKHVWTLAIVLAGNIVVLLDPLPKRMNNTYGLAILLSTYVFLFGFCAVNINKKAMWVVMAGVLSNAVVIGLNQGMPVTKSGGYLVKETIKHQTSKSSDLLPWLTDIIPINFMSIAISVGDIIFGLGLVLVCFFASRKDKASDEDSNEPIIEDEIVLSDDTRELAIVDQSTDTTEPDQEPEMVEYEMSNPTVATVTSPTKMVKPKSKKITRGPKVKHKSKKDKWHEHHGLAALPSKEELGFDDQTMEIVKGPDA